MSLTGKRYTPEQIVAKLRQAEVELAKRQATGLVCKTPGIGEQSDYRWRHEYGRLTVDQAKRLLEDWRQEYHDVRPHSPLADQVPEACVTRLLELAPAADRRGQRAG